MPTVAPYVRARNPRVIYSEFSRNFLKIFFKFPYIFPTIFFFFFFNVRKLKMGGLQAPLLNPALLAFAIFKNFINRNIL